MVSFPLEGLNNPQKCEITINSLTFYLINKPRYKIQIGETLAFRNIKSDISLIDNILGKVKSGKGTEKTKKATNIIANKPTKAISQEKTEFNIEDIKHFITSYEKFKSQVKDSDIQELLVNKSGTIDFNLLSIIR